MSVNLAPAASVTVNIIGGTPTETIGSSININDESEVITSGCYGFIENTYNGITEISAIIDLGSSKDISKIVSKFRGDVVVGDTWGFLYVDYDISTSPDGINYTSQYFGQSPMAETSGDLYFDIEKNVKSFITCRYVKFTATTSYNPSENAEDAVRFLIKEIEVYDQTISNEGENIALTSTATGSVQNEEEEGDPENVIDNDWDTYYGFTTATTDSFVVTIDLEFPESKAISGFAFVQKALIGIWELPASAIVGWEILSSNDGSNYISQDSGEDFVYDSFQFDGLEEKTKSMTAKYIRLVINIATNFTDTGCLLYKFCELYVFGQDLFDIGLRCGSLTVGAKIATDSEALRISVNGQTYGIPFDPSSPLKIKAGTITGLSKI